MSDDTFLKRNSSRNVLSNKDNILTASLPNYLGRI